MSETQLRQALRESRFSVEQYPEIRDLQTTEDHKYLQLFWDSPVPVGMLVSLMKHLPDDAMMGAKGGTTGIQMTWRIA